MSLKLPRAMLFPHVYSVSGYVPTAPERLNLGMPGKKPPGKRHLLYQAPKIVCVLCPSSLHDVAVYCFDSLRIRCLGPFLVETCALVEAGVGLEQLDKVMKSYGLPVGPITLADEVRWDVVPAK